MTTSIKNNAVVLKPTLSIGVSPMLNQWMVRIDYDLMDQLLENNPELKGVKINKYLVEDEKDLITVEGLEKSSRFDLIIWHQPFQNMRDTDLIIPRFPKSEQQVMLAQSHVGGRFRPLESHTVHLGTARSYDRRSVPQLAAKRWIVRPESGARAIGQLVINTRFIDMVHALNHISEDLLTGKKVVDGITIGSGDQNYELEGFNLLKESLFIQELVQNVSSEFRIILGKGACVEAISTRKRIQVSSDYQCVDAASADRLVYQNSDSIHDLNDIAAKLGLGLDELNRLNTLFSTNPQMQYNSVDLFVDADGRWGIFEFCNQFATADLPSLAVDKILTKWLSNHLINHGFHKLINND